MPTVLITGSAKRIGLAIAEFFASGGYNIAMHCNESKEKAQIEAERISKKFKIKCVVFACDLSKPELIPEFFQNILNEFKQVDVLINNASVFQESSIFDISYHEILENFNIHFFAPVFLSQAFAKQETLENGLIINMLDKNITRTQTKYFGYLQSKKALAELTKYLAIILAPKIRVNAISPGFIIEEEGTIPDKTYITKKLKSIPLQKQGSIEDIIKAVEYLLKAGYTNGQNLFIDGGSFLTTPCP
jgi:NAD(P)-dependent dehydrogenase (short-subunit alcohol dehydrogenase family)